MNATIDEKTLARRADLRLESRAVELGWTVSRNVLDEMEPVPKVPQMPLTFYKGDYVEGKKVIWKTKRVWTCADMVLEGQGYINHRKYDDLAIALENESQPNRKSVAVA